MRTAGVCCDAASEPPRPVSKFEFVKCGAYAARAAHAMQMHRPTLTTRRSHRPVVFGHVVRRCERRAVLPTRHRLSKYCCVFAVCSFVWFASSRRPTAFSDGNSCVAEQPAPLDTRQPVTIHPTFEVVSRNASHTIDAVFCAMNCR